MYNRDVTNPPFGGRFHFVRVSHDSGHKYCARKRRIKSSGRYLMSFDTIGFVGLGLIGGSIAKALKRVHPEKTVVAYNRNGAVLDLAAEDGIVDVAVKDETGGQKADEILAPFSECDLIFLCVPVVTALDFMDRLKSIMKPGAILTDVGSVKGGIDRYAAEHGLSANFIGGHPMAGSEKTGYQNSKDRLIENAWYILLSLIHI